MKSQNQFLSTKRVRMRTDVLAAEYQEIENRLMKLELLREMNQIMIGTPVNEWRKVVEYLRPLVKRERYNARKRLEAARRRQRRASEGYSKSEGKEGMNE